ncbi:MAG: hypothetical protein Q8N18_09775 [Opitutaceae bacterium]|nr:hypothetical protein [Opitutaceae bacterium]
MRRLLLASLLLAAATGATARTEKPIKLLEAQAHAAQVREYLAETFAAAAGSSDPTSLRGKLADYAALPAGAADRVENLIEAARRTLAGGPATKRTPDAAIFRLDELADALFAAVDAAEVSARGARDSALEREFAEVRARGHLARYHARRIVAAMHYNLFLRGQRLAELVAATYAEKDAVTAWRQLTTLPASKEITEARHAELKKLEASYKDLEDQCCPPDEAIMREKVWQPVRVEKTAKSL